MGAVVEVKYFNSFVLKKTVKESDNTMQKIIIFVAFINDQYLDNANHLHSISRVIICQVIFYFKLIKKALTLKKYQG